MPLFILGTIKKNSKQRHLIALDGLFSVTVIGSLVVLVWRGSFLLLDLVMFPENAEWSAWGSTVNIHFTLSPTQKIFKLKQLN